MGAEQRRAAKEQMIALMQAGHHWQEAAAQAGIQVSRSTAYRLLRQVRSRGKAAFQDGRHGHPAKLRTDERAWLGMRDWPSHPSDQLQARAKRASPPRRGATACGAGQSATKTPRWRCVVLPLNQ